MRTGLVHGRRRGTLEHQITMLHEDRALLERLRAESLRTVQEITWTAAGRKLLQVYRETVAAQSEPIISAA